MKLREMRQKRDAILAAARAIQDKADAENRALTDEETKAFDAHMAEAKAMKADIARREALEAEQREQDAPANEAIRPDPEQRATPAAKPKGPFASFGEQLMAAVRAADRNNPVVDKRLYEVRAISGLNESVGAEGGFLLQPDYAATLLERMYETGQIVGRCAPITVGNGANTIKINAMDETSRVAGSRWGGVQVYWNSEAGQKTATKPAFRQINMQLHKLTGMCYATDESLEDAAQLESIIMRVFPQEFDFKVEDAIVNGLGAGQPLGILNSPALVTVAKEGGQPAKTILSQNVMNMWSRLWARSRNTAVWLINQDIEPQLYSMYVAVGVAGIPVFMPAGGMSGLHYATLFGRPVIPVEYCATLGTVGDIILADMNEYLLARKGGLQTASSIHFRFDYDETVFRFVLRLDGQPAWNAPLTPFKGSNTLSPFVALATRA